MRVVLLTLYDQTCHGARCLAASAARAGHEVLLITFKQFLIKMIDRANTREFEEIAARGHMPLYDVMPGGDVAVPYPTPITAHEKEILLETIEKFAPDVLGFSLTSINLPTVFEVAGDIRRKFPRLPQVWGGIHPTMEPEACLQYADAVCISEGDEAFLEYLADPRRTDIRNFWCKDGDGAIIRNPVRPLLQDLDSLPIPMYGDAAREVLIDQDRVMGITDFSNRDDEPYAHLVIRSQRGCPFNCTYCVHSGVRDLHPHQKYLRRQSVDKFLDEVELRVRQYGLEWFYIWDDVFMMQREWIEEFCDKYPKRIGIGFGGFGHPQTTSKAMLEMLRKAGCTLTVVGIQSGSQRIAKELYGRRVPNEAFVQFGKDLVDAGYAGGMVYELITSNPFETEEDLRASVELLARLPKPISVSLRRLGFFPFTHISRMERPKSTLDARTYLFYDMLILLAGQPGVPMEVIGSLVKDPYLREHPEIIEKWAQDLARAGEERAALEKEAKRLAAQMPWGINRATKHWVGQVRNRLARGL